jgi:hypothetical protein
MVASVIQHQEFVSYAQQVVKHAIFKRQIVHLVTLRGFYTKIRVRTPAQTVLSLSTQLVHAKPAILHVKPALSPLQIAHLALIQLNMF